jgi:hypothetical protein
MRPRPRRDGWKRARLFAASEARAAGHGGVVAVSRAAGIARSTIDRGLADLRSGAVMFSTRVRRQDGGGKPTTETQPRLLKALNDLVQPAIRGDPEAALLWVSKSQQQPQSAILLTARRFQQYAPSKSSSSSQ